MNRLAAKLVVADCWTWTGTRTRNGYGQVRRAGKAWVVHRYVWTTLVGPIPPDMDLDHLCRNRLCCNPDHLEPVTRAENMRRGAPNQNARRTHCRKGHPLSGENLRMENGRRRCRACQLATVRRYKAKLRGPA